MLCGALCSVSQSATDHRAFCGSCDPGKVAFLCWSHGSDLVTGYDCQVPGTVRMPRAAALGVFLTKSTCSPYVTNRALF